MKLVVTEMTSVSMPSEREFVLPIVKIGRDNEQCDIVFDRVTWPMVSRYHAEFRLEGDKCLLIDANSTFGTFLNGERVKEPVEVRKSAMVQFGAGGPTLCILSIAENGSTPEQGGTPDEIAQPVDQFTPAVWLALESSGNGPHQRVQLDSDTMLLGRDPRSVIKFDSAEISRRHAEIRRSNERFVIVDLGSYNGTFVNDQRVEEPTFLYHNDHIQLGKSGPMVRFFDPVNPRLSENGRSEAAVDLQRGVTPNAPQLKNGSNESETIVAALDARPNPQSATVSDTEKAQPVLRCSFYDKPYISVGRGPDNDIRLDSLQISVQHARFIKDRDRILVEDKSSTNGVYLNGQRIAQGRATVQQNDVVQIGPFVLQATANGVGVFDTRSKARIDVLNVNKTVAECSSDSLKLLDAVDLTIQPNEFVGLLGASGAGKSTLMGALNGTSAPSGGHVLINDLDLYRHLDSLKHSIGYVPQDDIIHRELTVYRTLFYVAALRLSRDVRREEIDQIINEVLEVTGLTERRDVPVARLSGGQRKRVSIAVELITKPSIIFLDEPTSGLDPATEEKIMKLFRQLAESGRTVVLTTHNTANVYLFDKIVVLMQGKVVFYGEPREALDHFQVTSFKDLYDILKDSGPAQSPAKENQPANMENTADAWRRCFHESELYQRHVVQPLSEVKTNSLSGTVTRRRLKISDAIRQWTTLVRRYSEILLRDRSTLFVLLGQAPVIAFLTYLVINDKAPRDFPFFMLALVSMWFGTSVAAREIVRERAVYNRERMVNLGLVPYVASKITVLAIVVTTQCVLLLGTLKSLHYAHLIFLPGAYGGAAQLLLMILTGVVAIALGLLVSAIVKSSETATSLVPLLLIPQILFSGLIGVPKGPAKVAGAAMPVTWSFDEMKRLSNLESLNEEGSIAKYLEEKSKEQSRDSQKSIEEFNGEIRSSLDDYGRRVEEYLIQVRMNPGLPRPQPPVLPNTPRVAEPSVNDDLKDFVSFKHPWGSVLVNPLVLFGMLLLLVAGTVSVLRAQDKG